MKFSEIDGVFLKLGIDFWKRSLIERMLLDGTNDGESQPYTSSCKRESSSCVFLLFTTPYLMLRGVARDMGGAFDRFNGILAFG